jgi:hypothetical protein
MATRMLSDLDTQSSAYCREQSWWNELVENTDTFELFIDCIRELHSEEKLLVLECFGRDVAQKHPSIGKQVMRMVRVRCLWHWERPYLFLHSKELRLYMQYTE